MERRFLKRLMRFSALAGILLFVVASAYAATTELVSVSSEGEPGNYNHKSPSSISADGRFVAFHSGASNLVPGDTNDVYDIFVHDRDTGVTERVSVASDGTQADSGSVFPAISADGRYVVFHSGARTLVPGISPNTTFIGSYVFIHDRELHKTEAIAYGSSASISADGRYVAFAGHIPYPSGIGQILVFDTTNKTIELVSKGRYGFPGLGHSQWPSISADGRFVAFQSRANNLVFGDTNDQPDIFVYDRENRVTKRVSVASNGEQGDGFCIHDSISADGRYIAFESTSNNLVQGDTNSRYYDVFVHDRDTGVTELVSKNSDGTIMGGFDPAISADGRLIAFDMRSTYNRNQIFVHDRETEVTEIVSVANDGSQGNAHSHFPSISGDGRFVAFHSYATNLISIDTPFFGGIYVRDRAEEISIPELVENVVETVLEIPLDYLQNPADQRINALQNKLQDILAQLNTIDETTTADEKYAIYSVVLDKLNNDILAKTDGFHGGNPKNDWIVTQAGQDLLYPEVVKIIEALEAELAKL